MSDMLIIHLEDYCVMNVLVLLFDSMCLSVF